MGVPTVTRADAITIPAHPGYWLLGGDGGVFTHGARFAGSAAADPAACPANSTDRAMPNGTCFAMAARPDGKGYWILNASTGKVFPFGNAAFYGDPETSDAGVPREFVPNSIAIVSTPSGNGYWILESGLSGLGGVRAYGDAEFYGDTVHLGQGHRGVPVGMAATPDGKGYWIVDSDGGVFNFGNAQYHGSLGTIVLATRVVGIAATLSGDGYYLASADGGVYAFGDARFAGSAFGIGLVRPIVGVAANVSGSGYWLVASDGGVFSFGGAPFLGSQGGTALERPIFAIAATANGA